MTLDSATIPERSMEFLFDEIRHVVSEVPRAAVDRVQRVGHEHPLTEQETRRLLAKTIDAIIEKARQRGDSGVASYLESERETIMERVILKAHQYFTRRAGAASLSNGQLHLRRHKGVEPRPVHPTPTFHGRQILVMEGFVNVNDIRLWDENERLTIHVKQFKKAHGRSPTADDLVAIMRSEAQLPVPGLDGNDQFKIVDLARSVATNGVRTAPVIAYDGTLLDGNRRVAACLHVLNSEDFSSEEKERVKTIRVWQLPEAAGEDEKNAVVVALNFEPDYKEDWPEYVKAGKVYEEWQGLLSLERRPTAAQQKKLRQELARRFALTPHRVTRYIDMAELAAEFEEYQRNEQSRDEYEVKHAADRYFQYFDELGKGRNSGGVNWSINQDDSFKHLVFDLLHTGKFRNWSQIRDLKYVYQNDEATELLTEARKIEDVDRAKEFVDDGLSAARTARAQERKIGGNKRIETFVKWLREAPVEFFSVGEPGAIKPDNLRRLYEALKLVERYLPDGLRRGVN